MLSDLPLYGKALQIWITAVSVRSNRKDVHSNRNLERQMWLYQVDGDNGNGNFTIITKVNVVLGHSIYG